MADRDVKEVPGRLGMPICGKILDRIRYFRHGPPEFFREKIKKYQSTVIRMNMPPAPPIVCGRADVVMLLDGKCFSTLFDPSKVEKNNCLTGYFRPDIKFFGGHRTCVYMDTSEEGHSSKKKFCMSLLTKSFEKLGAEFDRVFEEFCLRNEKHIARTGCALFDFSIAQFLFNLICRTIGGVDPAPALGKTGPYITGLWLIPQIAPLGSSRVLPKIIDEIAMHTFRIPFFVISPFYTRICNFIRTYASSTLAEAQNTFQVPQDEALHDLIFNLCFNGFGGMIIFFPYLFGYLARAGPDLHCRLAAEARAQKDLAKAAMNGDQLRLARSCVYEVLRLDPPVDLQYGFAKEDIDIESSTGVYRVHKGQLIGGYQRFATRDPTLFDRAEEFVADRFVDEKERKRLLPYVLWSNGPETATPGIANKQCPGKDFVITVATLFVASFFKRYDSFSLVQAPERLALFPMIASLVKPKS